MQSSAMMQINSAWKAKIRWSCRRGMKELDLLLLPFFEDCFDKLNPYSQQVFERILALDDLILFHCFFQHQQLNNHDDQQMIMSILDYQRTVADNVAN